MCAKLANSLVRLGDVSGGKHQYDAALASTEETTDRVRIAAHLGLANCLFDLGDSAQGRRHFAEAVQLHSPDETGRRMAFGVCINEWLSRELDAGDNGEPATAVRAGRAIVERAAAVAQPPAWALDGQMALRRRATRTTFANDEYSEEIVGYEDDDVVVASEPRSKEATGDERPSRDR